MEEPRSPSSAPDRSLLAMMDEAQHRLQHLEISCRQILSPPSAPSPQRSQPDDPELLKLKLQVTHLQTQLLAAVTRREEDDIAFRHAARFETAKGVANGVLHALFDQASLGKVAVLRDYLDSGSIPTRDGLRHWRLDLRSVRNEAGASLMHVAVGVSTARERVKVKLVQLLLDRAKFDPNVPDVFGRTPLHVAAMGGFQEVVQVLLDRGADPTAQDRAGTTALSLVRTLSRPPKEVVQTLVDAESAAIRKVISRSESIPLPKALASALFLQKLAPFTLQQSSSAFTRQTAALVNALLEAAHEDCVDFDRVLQERVPMLFDAVPAYQVIRLDTLLTKELYWDSDFVNDLKVETNGYGLSLVSTTVAIDALAGPTWGGVLVKLIQCFKAEMAKSAQDDALASANPAAPQAVPSDTDIVMKEADASALVASPSRKWSISSSSSSLLVDTQSAQNYADQSLAKTRQAWYYAVLFKASTHELPGTLSLTPESDVVVSSEDVSKYFPLEDPLSIGSSEYFAVEYNPRTRKIRLDHAYEGKQAATFKAFFSGAFSSGLPPYVAVKRIWEREPGNKYEDQMSSEQELFQDYQFLDPESEYEVAIKLGPVLSEKEAKAIVAEWKRTAKELYNSRKCTSEWASCKHYCPQRSGHALCLGSLTVIGQSLAKDRLGRPTFSKSLKPRASLQRLQDRFKGTDEWPGSPSRVQPVVLSSPP